MREIEVRTLTTDGDCDLVKALAVISVVRAEDGFKLIIQENGELTEEWWRTLPDALKNTIEMGLESRRETNE